MAEAPHIVVVDDDEDIREMFAEYLRLRGYRVSEAGSGDALRQVLAGSPADLVLLDLNMPGEDGMSLAHWLRRTTGAGLILVTGAATPPDAAAPADDVLAKPCDLGTLAARVAAVLGRRR